MLAVTNVQLAIFFFTRRRIENHTFNPASVSCALAMLTIQNIAAKQSGARSANFFFLTIRALSEFDSPRKLQIWISTVCARTITCGT
jgi:hypothetical protein